MNKKSIDKLTIQIPCSIIKEAIKSGEKTLNISLNLELGSLIDEADIESNNDDLIGIYEQELSGVAALSLRFN